ncbi:TIGR00159 family protein [PVC group bacterium (ex Bugula neritina AB1)]|nr:TIGR00159 family protein [PVC group bacterium (ex Bugula neritina AB1)]
MIWILLYAWRPFVEIFIISVAIYYVTKFIRGTLSENLLKGLGLIFVIFVISQKLEFLVINWLLTKVFAISLIVFLILFQPELRRVLAKIGQNRILGNFLREKSFVHEIVKACIFLSSKRIGALIVIERKTGLGNYIESGIFLDSHLTKELIVSLFMPTTPLHDGALIVQGERISAAGCLLPLTENPVQQTLGTRHRSALGLSEETDAIVLVVSEETGIISLVKEGAITRDLGEKRLEDLLTKLILSTEEV